MGQNKIIVKVAKAEAIGKLPVADAEIHIKDSVPSHCNLDDLQELFVKDAEKIYNALMALPQGTKHQLLIKMLQGWKLLYIGK